jgi:hypothetical protein
VELQFTLLQENVLKKAYRSGIDESLSKHHNDTKNTHFPIITMPGIETKLLDPNQESGEGTEENEPQIVNSQVERVRCPRVVSTDHTPKEFRELRGLLAEAMCGEPEMPVQNEGEIIEPHGMPLDTKRIWGEEVVLPTQPTLPSQAR